MNVISLCCNLGIVTSIMTPILPFSITTPTVKETKEQYYLIFIVSLVLCCQTLDDEIRDSGSSRLIDVWGEEC